MQRVARRVKRVQDSGLPDGAVLVRGLGGHGGVGAGGGRKK